MHKPVEIGLFFRVGESDQGRKEFSDLQKVYTFKWLKSKIVVNI